jgi:methylmalonyl-CoA/ethylmalonyl-CoA epimerase
LAKIYLPLAEGEVLLEKIHHLGYAVESVEAASRFYRERFGAETTPLETVEGQGIVATMFEVGDSMIELMEPTHADSPVGRFLARRGEGFHHVAFQVEDIEAALAELEHHGVELVYSEPRVGAGGTRTAFIHPRGAFGVLTELVELPHRGR